MPSPPFGHKFFCNSCILLNFCLFVCLEFILFACYHVAKFMNEHFSLIEISSFGETKENVST